MTIPNIRMANIHCSNQFPLVLVKLLFSNLKETKNRQQQPASGKKSMNGRNEICPPFCYLKWKTFNYRQPSDVKEVKLRAEWKGKPFQVPTYEKVNRIQYSFCSILGWLSYILFSISFRQTNGFKKKFPKSNNIKIFYRSFKEDISLFIISAQFPIIEFT